jgi:hypothetical protein
MDKGTLGVVTGRKDDADQAAIEREIQLIRGNLEGLVDELDHRRHRLNPAVAAARHPSGFIIAGVLVAGAVSAAILLHNARVRRQRSWLGRGRRFKAALMELMEGKPVAVSPRFGTRVLTAVTSAAAAAVGKRLVTKMLSRNR